MAAKITCQKFACVFLCFFIVVTEVAPWTIDLPEVRRHLFEYHNKISKNEYEDYVHGDRSFYSNIQGNSKHNSEGHYDSEKYAHEFGYQSYMEKRVQEIVHDGSRYLEGLRRSLDDYSRFLQECNRRNMTNFSNSTSSNSTSFNPTSFNFTSFNSTSFNPTSSNSTSSNSTSSNSSWSPPVSPRSPDMTMSFNSSDTRFLEFDTGNWSGVPPMNMNSNGMNMSRMNMSGMNMTGMDMSWMNSTGMNMTWMNTSSGMRMSCREATEASESVRRHAALATWATERLQDLAYADKYQKTDQYEENELILKLAWFLDQLAALTGYEPQYKDNMPYTTTPAPTSAPMAPTFVPQTQELTNFLMNCIKANSSEPATVRCRYPFPIPDLVAQISGSTTSTESSQSSGTNVLPMTPTDSEAQQSLELLITADDSRNPRRITKRSPIPDEYYVPVPVHEKPPKPIVEFIVKKLSNLKAIVKTVKKHAVADFATQIAIHKQLHKRSIDNDSSVLINRLSNNPKPIVKLDKPTDEDVPTIHLPVLDVSVINTKSFKKRSIDDNSMYPKLNNILPKRKLAVNSLETTVKSIKKRSTDNPLSKLANYYIKYKVWDGSNPSHEKQNVIAANFDINNILQPSRISRRPLLYKKNRHVLVPKSLELIHSIKHNYKEIHAKKFQLIHSKRHNLKKIHAKKANETLLSDIKNNLKKKHKTFEKGRHRITKRSLFYEHMYLPRISENPVGDISYYVKNKEGRDYNPSLTQAARVRLGLQQAFETGNIEVIHRYGSNYNPANPAPFYVGVLKGMADS